MDHFYFIRHGETVFNQFISSAIMEKITALETEDYLSKRAQKADKKAFKTMLDLVPDIPANNFDK